jgi:TIR domain
MILILYQDSLHGHAEKAAADLRDCYHDLIVETAKADSSASWSATPEWDDLMIVMYDDPADFPADGSVFVAEYRKKRSAPGAILPVSLNKDPSKRRPPSVLDDIKALSYDITLTGKDGPLARRVGAMLGLRLQGRDAKIFLSHRATDGRKIALQLHECMTSLGYRPFLDEAKDLDGDTKILPGSPVQMEIDAALDGASLLLLIDTPNSLNSRWVKHEVDTATASLLPVLPICFRKAGDASKGPRFRVVRDLQRWEELAMPVDKDNPLTPSELDTIVQAAELYLCEIVRRKRRVPSIVEREFVSKGFAWKVLDSRLLMYSSSKQHARRLTTKVLSHCSIFKEVYSPALNKFRTYLDSAEPANHALFIYDGDLLPEWELADLVDDAGDPIIILHHQELAELIHSNFTTLGKP